MTAPPGHIHRRALLALGALLVCALTLLAVPFGAAHAASPPANCVPATSVSVIVDDSGSMERNDPRRLRRRALELLLTKPTGQHRTVGAVEFGEDAGSLFAPAVVGSGRAAMLASLSALDDDGYREGGSTDYDEAFDVAAAQQPDANARIFLTDGGHNDGVYLDSHAGGPRTYVIGLNVGPARSGTDEAQLLERIASDTGGAYFPLDRTGRDSIATQSGRLQSVFNEIDALLDCTTVADRRVVRLTRPGRSGKDLTFTFRSRPALELVTSWTNSQSRIHVWRIVVCDRRGRIVADLRGRRGGRSHPRRAKLRIRRVNGETFVTVVIKRPKRGTSVKVRLKGTRLPQPEALLVQARPLDAFPPEPADNQPKPAETAPPQPDPLAPDPEPARLLPPTPHQPARPPARVNAYDNYGPANAGRAMCRGNPGRPESMPGGTASQSFTVPAGVASIDRVLVQIDPDTRVSARMTLNVNGQVRATATAPAVGDTTFTFGAVPVRAGDAVTVSISFTATFGKIITVYTAGSPVGTFTASNSCPDGAPNVHTTTTGLRAVVSGYDR